MLVPVQYREYENSLLKLRTISNIPGLMGIAVTDGGTVSLSFSKEHAQFSLTEKEMLWGTVTLTKVCGEIAGHRDSAKVDGISLLLYADTCIEALFWYAIR